MSAPLVLVVDDDPSVLEMIQAALDFEGYEVMTARHGGEALERIAGRPPDVILLDMRMPHMSGWEFASAYRALPGRKAPIIAFTAASDAQERARKIDADDVLAKPFELSDLYDVLARHARR